MNSVLRSIEGEYRRYKKLAEDAVAQVGDGDLARRSGESGNSIATLLQHIGGNLRSRFQDFLTSDGEKPWRDREAEFSDRGLSRSELMKIWDDGWRELFAALQGIDEKHFDTNVKIRGVELSVIEALTRSLAHTSYHVGQIVLIAKEIRGKRWSYLSIPPGGSTAYNAQPKLEKPPK